MITKTMLRATLHGLVQEKMLLTRRRTQFKHKTAGEAGEGWRLDALSRLDGRRYSVRSSIRYHHLALGMVRGVPYRRMEPRCHEDNEPDPERIRRVLDSFMPYGEYRAWTIERIQGWLDGDGAAQEAAE